MSLLFKPKLMIKLDEKFRIFYETLTGNSENIDKSNLKSNIKTNLTLSYFYRKTHTQLTRITRNSYHFRCCSYHIHWPKNEAPKKLQHFKN